MVAMEVSVRRSNGHRAVAGAALRLLALAGAAIVAYLLLSAVDGPAQAGTTGRDLPLPVQDLPLSGGRAPSTAPARVIDTITDTVRTPLTRSDAARHRTPATRAVPPPQRAEPRQQAHRQQAPRIRASILAGAAARAADTGVPSTRVDQALPRSSRRAGLPETERRSGPVSGPLTTTTDATVEPIGPALDDLTTVVHGAVEPIGPVVGGVTAVLDGTASALDTTVESLVDAIAQGTDPIQAALSPTGCWLVPPVPLPVDPLPGGLGLSEPGSPGVPADLDAPLAAASPALAVPIAQVPIIQPGPPSPDWAAGAAVSGAGDGGLPTNRLPGRYRPLPPQPAPYPSPGGTGGGSSSSGGAPSAAITERSPSHLMLAVGRAHLPEDVTADGLAPGTAALPG